ncbi:MAG TPA: hypothetical protein VNZ03_28305, partial [Terriglobales bacterium]|nr:hypothetical protein [Terriglobales bacterium]
ASGQYSLAAVVRLFKIAHFSLGSSGSAGVSPASRWTSLGGKHAGNHASATPRTHKTYVRYRTVGL